MALISFLVAVRANKSLMARYSAMFENTKLSVKYSDILFDCIQLQHTPQHLYYNYSQLLLSSPSALQVSICYYLNPCIQYNFFCNYFMLHSRLASPKRNHNSQSNHNHALIARSKSTSNVGFTNIKTDHYAKKSDLMQIKTLIRATSAFKLSSQQQQSNSALPKVSSFKGKLHLGKINKPGVILSSEIRNNPWIQPTPINQQFINKKGLMGMVNMGMIPRNADFTDLLNHKYEEKKQKQIIQTTVQQQNNDLTTFFPTNPNVLQNTQPQKNVQQANISLKKPVQSVQSQKQSNQKKMRKKIKKSSNKKQKIDQNLFLFNNQVTVLQINNQKVVQNEKYLQQLKRVKRNGNQTAFKQYIKNVETFAIKYSLKKFQFKVLIDQTHKASDEIIKNQIINAKALGIHYAMKGSLNNRTKQILRMFLIKYKFKKTRRELLKIQIIKRYFKVRKYYEEMTRKRVDLFKFKLGSFVERQRRFIEQARQKEGSNQRFRTQIHLLAISCDSYEEQRSYYKIQCRNNIQLTRIFNTEPETILLLLDQKQFDFSCWLNLVKKIKGYHPKIQAVFLNFQNFKVRIYESIYYGLTPETIGTIKKLKGRNDNNCMIPSSLNLSVVKICETLNCKLYSSSFCKLDLQKILKDDDQPHHPEQIEKKQIETKFSNQAIRNLTNKTSMNQKSNPSKLQRCFTQSQINHSYQKARGKQLFSYKLIGQYFSNKLILKQEILRAHKFSTPLSLAFAPQTQEHSLFFKLTEIILQQKNVNKWVFKIGNTARFSRGLAFLQTDTLKILKEKKKKAKLTQSDICEVANIMKIILLDKLEIPQNSLQDSQQYLNSFLKHGGYVEAMLPEMSTQCIFGQISAMGQFKILGSYSKIYTNDGINCAACYPSNGITLQIIQESKKLAKVLYQTHQIFGYVTFELLVNKKIKAHYFIDIILTLQQYSSLYFMYTSMFINIHQEQEQPVKIVKKYTQKFIKKAELSKRSQITSNKSSDRQIQNSRQKQIKSNISQDQNEPFSSIMPLMRKIVYIPFIDNNGNTYENFQSFEQACQNRNLKKLDFSTIEGIQFLYLNLKQQKPDVLSLVVFSTSQKKSLKYALDGLNFLQETGEKTNKFDKKVERRKYDCFYLNDIIWKFRQLKKSKDVVANSNIQK